MSLRYGIDVGGTTVKIGLIDRNGKFVDKYEIKTDISNHGNNILKDICASVLGNMKKHNLTKNDVDGFGFGVPGSVVDGVVLGCVNLGWGKVNVKENFKELLGFDTIIEIGNDANVAALGEMTYGVGGNYQNAVMFTLGTGVGGGIVVNGNPHNGTNGSAGELGHMFIDRKHMYKCNCGLCGCLETVASATGIVRLANEYVGSIPSRLDDIEDFTAKDIFDLAKENDELALKVVDEVADYLGVASQIVGVNYDPEIFIIGGGVSKAGNYLVDAIKNKYKKYAYHTMKETPFALAALGNDAGMLGASLLIKK